MRVLDVSSTLLGKSFEHGADKSAGERIARENLLGRPRTATARTGGAPPSKGLVLRVSNASRRVWCSRERLQSAFTSLECLRGLCSDVCFTNWRFFLLGLAVFLSRALFGV